MITMLDVLAKNWWTFVLRGVLAIIFGLVAWAWPDLTLNTILLLFAAYAIVDGIFAIVAAIMVGRQGRWLSLLITGLAGIVFGIVVFLWPDITALALLYLIGAWAIAIGILQVIAAIELRKWIEGEWLLGLAGVAAVIFGILVVLFPGDGALALIWTVGLFAIVFGVLLIVLGFRLRSVNKEIETRESRLAH
jgi:uncharacterized membrane protein HdeD (DUF308 family)